jgi:hypothetical protein
MVKTEERAQGVKDSRVREKSIEFFSGAAEALKS